MKNRTVFRTGVIGAGVAALCCATPALPFILGAIGLSAWLAYADRVLVPLLVVFVALAMWAHHRRRTAKNCVSPVDTASSAAGDRQ